MITIYHNPSCSKSRVCLQLIEQSGEAFKVIDYRHEPLTSECIRQFAKKLGHRAIIREQEALYKELNLSEADEETILNALVTYPQLLQRPIVVRGDQMLIARPPQKVLEFLND